ncbi:helix-turn-helix domain-containing protein [Kutzneria viridogrisea]|nr:helix-turn-helix domain-containing protein [Kutzneria albida]MBA8928537.1 hypothetical protein [Kutzneria viridogrisea]
MPTELGTRVPTARRSAEVLGEGNARGRAIQLWISLPPDLVQRFRPHVQPLARDMIREIQLAVPAYALPLRGEFGKVMTSSIEQAILRCMDTAETQARHDEQWAGVFRHLGRIEFTEGRNLDHLQTAYRVGGRVAWRHVAAFGQQQRLPAEVFSVAAEAIFAYVDELSALSIEGYTAAQAEAVGSTERRRRRLLELILSEPPASPQAIAEAAKLARWRLPERVTVIALEQRADQHRIPAPALQVDGLVDLEGDRPCVLTAAPPRALHQLARSLQGWRACVGPTVSLGEAAVSLRLARRAITLVQRGIIPDRPVTWCEENLSQLWLLADEFLVSKLVERTLAPLAGLTTKQRDRIAETLLAWLETRGGAPEVAERLRIHPQTVRYRMRQVEKLFGPSLADPDARLDLEIALRAQHLLWSAR